MVHAHEQDYQNSCELVRLAHEDAEGNQHKNVWFISQWPWPGPGRALWGARGREWGGVRWGGEWGCGAMRGGGAPISPLRMLPRVSHISVLFEKSLTAMPRRAACCGPLSSPPSPPLISSPPPLLPRPLPLRLRGPLPSSALLWFLLDLLDVVLIRRRYGYTGSHTLQR